MRMKQFPMITISRQYGTGGHDIGEKLAEKLDLPFYDKDIIAIASKESRFGERAFEAAEETATTALGYALSKKSSAEDKATDEDCKLFHFLLGLT